MLEITGRKDPGTSNKVVNTSVKSRPEKLTAIDTSFQIVKSFSAIVRGWPEFPRIC